MIPNELLHMPHREANPHFFLDIDKKRLGLGSHIALKISNPLSSGLSLAGAWSRICRCGNKHAEMVDGRRYGQDF